ncbi:MAG TPA: FecR family protein, partial [Terriglobia bacterium]|nr:FecR family protein [Terriglobia bacterium]
MRIKVRPQFLPVGFAILIFVTALIFPLVNPQRAKAQDDSQTRVVRLSFVEGTVGILTPDSQEWAEAPINTPVEQGYELATQKDSYAEVQFENASTLRLGEISGVIFDRLEFSDSGRRVTRIEFEKGYGTFHTFSDSSQKFDVEAGDVNLSPQGESEFRIDRNDQAVRIEVWSGTVNFSGPLGNVELGQNQILTYGPGSGEPYDIESGLSPDEWDRWVAQRDQAESSQPQSVTPANYGGVESNNLYGWSDLSSYGSWGYYSNVGYAWFPYASYGWSPYSFGRWVWYPGFGYTWVSSEPWGWLPYHYGKWAFEPGAGWAWSPGSFANWSPALVNWYQGQGWVGWAPQVPANMTGSGAGCPLMAQGCMRVVSNRQFQTGTTITPQTNLRVDPQGGRRVSRPDLPATRLAMMPGAPLVTSFAASGMPTPTVGQPSSRTLRAGRSSSPNGSVARSAPGSSPWSSRRGHTEHTASTTGHHPHSSPFANAVGQASSVSPAHFNGARAPQSLPRSTRGIQAGGLISVGVVPVRPASAPHSA